MDSSITQLQAEGLSRTRKESKKEEEEVGWRIYAGPRLVVRVDSPSLSPARAPSNRDEPPRIRVCRGSVFSSLQRISRNNKKFLVNFW